MAIQATQRPEKPKHHPLTPIGTPDELKEFGFSPRLYGSCSAKVVAGGTMVNIGCDEFPDCPYPKNGPENRVYRHVKNNDTILVRESPCYACLAAKRQIEGKGELFQDIGGPGTKYTMGISARSSQVRIEEWVQDAQIEHDAGIKPAREILATWVKDRQRDHGVLMKADEKLEPRKFTEADAPPDLRFAAVARTFTEKDAPKELQEAARAARLPKSEESFEPWRRRYECKPFPRPNKNPLLRESVTAEEHRKEMRQELVDRRVARVAGLSIEEVTEDDAGTRP